MERLVRFWTLSAVVSWSLSLLIPALLMEGEALTGYQTLLVGVLFGWMSYGWAAYANLFFLFAASRLWDGRSPRWSIIAMLALAATLPLFKGSMDHSGHFNRVASWGWGSLLWLVSLLMLATAAAVRNGMLEKRGTLKVALSLGIGVLAIGGLRLYQVIMANQQETSLYLSPGMAFTMSPLCGLELTAVDGPLVEPGTVVRLNMDPELRSLDHQPRIRLWDLSNDQQAGFSWASYQYGYRRSLKVQVDTPPDGPVLEVHKELGGAVIRLWNKPGGRVLYEQRLRAVSSVSGRPRYCPMDSWNDLRDGYDTRLYRALGQDQQMPVREPLREELARTPCNLGTEDLDGIKGLRLWDGRKVILEPDADRMLPGFCSESYVALVSAENHSKAEKNELTAWVTVFDRRTLRPLADFSNQRSCGTEEKCNAAPGNIIKGVQIANKQLVVESQIGNIVAPRLGE